MCGWASRPIRTVLYALLPIRKEMNSRVKKIFSELSDQVDVVLLMNDVEPNIDLSFFYVTGLDSGIFEGCAALLWQDGSLELLVSELEETTASQAGVSVTTFKTKKQREELLKETLKGAKTIGLNGAGLTYRNMLMIGDLLPEVRPVDVHPAIEAARLIKDQEELERIREACRIVSRVADEIPLFLKEGMREYEAAAEIVYRMQRMGASSPSFTTLAAFGVHSAEPHYMGGSGVLRRGETALFDFGALYHKYASDITRTFFAREVSERWERVYEVVMEAREAALREMRSGVEAQSVDASARHVIDSTEFRGRFIHSLGHGLGLSVHDGGGMSPGAEMRLRENMVLTVEPGIYLYGEGGIRIEDDVLITKNGYEMLTDASRDLTVI